MKPTANHVNAIPIWDGHQRSSITLSPREADIATRGDRDGFVVVDRRNRWVAFLWFYWCASRNRPAVVMRLRKRRRAEVSVDLYCTNRRLTPAGWEAVVEVYDRHGSREMARVAKRGVSFSHYAHGTVRREVAEPLVRELLAILDTPGLTRIDHVPRTGSGWRRSRDG